MKKTFFLAIIALCYAFLLDGALKPVMALEGNSTTITEQQSGTTNETLHNTGTSLPHEVDYSNSTLLKYVRRGDILFETFPDYGLGDSYSVSIVEGIFYDTNYQQEYIRVIEVTEFGVSRGLLTPSRFQNNYGLIMRVKNASTAQIEYATLFCESQLGKGCKQLDIKNPLRDKESWYPAELIWAAFYWQQIQLAASNDEPYSRAVTSAEIIANPKCMGVGTYLAQTNIDYVDTYTHKLICSSNEIIEKHNFRRKVGEEGYKCVGCGYESQEADQSIEVNLNCHTHEKDLTEYCQEGTFLLFDLNVECEKSFKITASLLGKTKMPIQMKLYDYTMNIINETPVLSSNKLSGTITEFLGVGKYYLRVNYGSSFNSGDIHVVFEPTWGDDTKPISLDTPLSMLDHLHLTDNHLLENVAEYHNENNGAGYYKIMLNASRLDSLLVDYPEGTIVVKDANKTTPIYKYNLSEQTRLEAKNTDGINSLYVYLETNGYFYIYIYLPSGEYSAINLTITRVTDVHEIILEDKMQESFNDALFVENQIGDYSQIFTIDRLGYFDLVLSATQINNSTIKYVVFKEQYNTSTYKYITTLEAVGELNSTNSSVTQGLSLSAGKYYICYFNNTEGATITADLQRKCDTLTSTNYLLIDPGSGYECGSEVRFNQGAYNNHTITEGFTRMIYINPDVALYGTSRLMYEFYSSNEVYATVSKYGTVLAKSVAGDRQVTIYVVAKESPKAVYKIDLVILNDTSEQPRDLYSTVNHTYSFETTQGKFQFNLTDADCPYPRFQDYMWTFQIVEGDVNASVDYFGKVNVTGPCILELEGAYLTNMNIYVHITIHIV